MKNIHHNKKIIVIILLFFILIFILIFLKIYDLTNETRVKERQMNKLFGKAENNVFGNVTKYYIYGTHFNIEGNINIVNLSGIKIESINLILKNLNEEELRYKNRL